jgi:tRNA pseudouridine55 synthase
MSFPDGILLVDKPAGPTSYDIIRWIKPKLGGAKIGHAGTLDPIASGLLIVLIGKATRRQSDVMGSDKIYRCRLRFGVRTDTGDVTGRAVETSTEPPPDDERLWRILARLAGEHMQTPPMYSALKHKGVPLYKLARKGQVVERAPRRVAVRWLEPLEKEGDEASFRIRCSSGTYVRSLVEDIGAAAGVGATMTALCREAIGGFSLERAAPGQELKDLDAESLARNVVPLEALAS